MFVYRGVRQAESKRRCLCVCWEVSGQMWKVAAEENPSARGAVQAGSLAIEACVKCRQFFPLCKGLGTHRTESVATGPVKQKLEAERVNLAKNEKANQQRQTTSQSQTGTTSQSTHIYIYMWSAAGPHIYIYMVSIVTVAKSWISKPKIRTMGVSDLEHKAFSATL